MHYLRCFNKTIDKISEYAGIGVSFLIIFLMLAIPFEVVMRYIFKNPTEWSLEITQYILCALIAFGGAFTLRVQGHVNVDILYGRFNMKTRSLVNVFTYLILFFYLVLLIWKSGAVAARSMAWGETSSSAFNPPIWPVKFFIPIGAALLLLQAVVSYIRYIIQIISGKDEFEEPCDSPDKENIL